MSVPAPAIGIGYAVKNVLRLSNWRQTEQRAYLNLIVVSCINRLPQCACTVSTKNPFPQCALKDISNVAKCATRKKKVLTVVQIARTVMIPTLMELSIFVITAQPSPIQPKRIGMAMALLMHVRTHFLENNERNHFFTRL